MSVVGGREQAQESCRANFLLFLTMNFVASCGDMLQHAGFRWHDVF
jgi:hypothetical protein